jgi:hypothetical protein
MLPSVGFTRVYNVIHYIQQENAGLRSNFLEHIKLYIMYNKQKKSRVTKWVRVMCYTLAASQ